MNYQELTWNFFKNKNVPNKTIAAIMGNIQAESGFNPDIIEVGTGNGFGLCQWSFGRRTQLENYGTSFNHQLEFLWSELTGENTNITGANFQWINKTGYLKYDEFMKGEQDINDLTSAFCFCFERPSLEYAHLEFRQISSIQYYVEFVGDNPRGKTVKLIYPYWFGSNIKISYVENRFLLLNEHGNVVRIKNEVTNRIYYVAKSSIKIV